MKQRSHQQYNASRLIILVALAIIGLAPPIDAAEFIPLGQLPGQVGSSTADISHDGQFVLGMTNLDGGSFVSGNAGIFRWTRNQGMLQIGRTNSQFANMSADGSTLAWLSSPTGHVWTEETGLVGVSRKTEFGAGISDDGDVVVGMNDSRTTMVRWTPKRGLEDLATLEPANRDHRFGISPDGSVVVGALNLDQGTWPVDRQMVRELFRWTEKNGLTSLGDVPGHNFYSVTGISANGSVIAGVSGAVPMNTNEFEVPKSLWRWTEETGVVILEVGRADLNFQLSRDDRYSQQWLSADGSVLVGDILALDDEFRSVYRWTKSVGLQMLPKLPGYSHATALDMSPDGKWVFGQSYSLPFVNGDVTPWLWSDETGLVNVLDLFEVQGLGPDIEGWDQLWGQRPNLGGYGQISADARAIIGSGINPDGVFEGWVAYLDPIVVPEPAGAVLALALGFLSAGRFRARLQHSPRPDLCEPSIRLRSATLFDDRMGRRSPTTANSPRTKCHLRF
ncbi:MAG: hypothetical protein KDA60_00015 [Planctomycetales bacterium]|nr:hypothetical protein [Planctomycetales bacterium]